MTDLVDRLRYGSDRDVVSVAKIAADEIERLRKPLSDEQIEEVRVEVFKWRGSDLIPEVATFFARAIERAHGIGEEA